MIKTDILNGRGKLLERHLPVRGGAAPGGDVPQRHAVLQRVDVDHVDRRVWRRPVVGLYVRDVAVYDEYHVGLGEQRVLLARGELPAAVHRVVGGEVHPERARLDDGDSEQVGEADQGGHRFRVAAEVAGDDQRVPRPGEGRGDLAGDLLGE